MDTKAKGYLQVDETPIKVLDSDKKGAAHQGYYWVYHAPLDGTVLFDYSPTRGGSAPLPILGSLRGYLQTDDYWATLYRWNSCFLVLSIEKIYICILKFFPYVRYKCFNY